MNSLIYACLICWLFAAESFAKSTTDTTFIENVSKDLYGKCYSKCQSERVGLQDAKDNKAKCSKAVEYLDCIKKADTCSNNATLMTELDNLLKEVQKFCAGSTTPATAAGTATTTPTTTPATTPTTPTAHVVVPDNVPATSVRKRRAADNIDVAITNLLKQTVPCLGELCVKEKDDMFSSNPPTINCTLLESYGMCLVDKCSSLNKTVDKYNQKCGATNIQLFSYALFMAGLLFKILF